MSKTKNYKLTASLLSEYQENALNNAFDLLNEAKLLLVNKHHARAYFLAIASVEETGKSQIAYSAKGRNLKNDLVCNVIKKNFSNHSIKITSAFIGWIHGSKSLKKALKNAVDYSIDLKRVREASMYTDVDENTGYVFSPKKIIRPVAARDAVKLAEQCYLHSTDYFQRDVPILTLYQDKFLCIKQKDANKIINCENFWEYYLDQISVLTELNWMEAAVNYHEIYYLKGRSFLTNEHSE